MQEKNNFVFINDAFYPSNNACININDMALQRGYAIFDFFKTLNGRPVFLQQHLNRFYASAQAMRLPVTYTQEQLKEIINQLLTKNDIPDSGVRITLTGGYADDGYSIQQPNLIIVQRPLPISTITEINLITHHYQRQLPYVKTTDYLMAIYLKDYISQNNADDVLYCNQNEVRESPRANFFIVTKDKKIITPKTNVLSGITRQVILNLKNITEYMIKEEDFTIQELQNATEAFITSTTKGVLPVKSINNLKIGDTDSKPATLLLQQKLQKIIKEEIGIY